MTLTLTLRNCDSLPNGGPLQLALERRGAIVGRSPTVDWTLPDSQNFISSRHCEIRFDAGAYTLNDTSTNGTLVNGKAMSGPHKLAHGDVVTIGHYDVLVDLPVAAIPASGSAGGAPGGGSAPAWGGWDSHISNVPGEQDTSDWGRAPPSSAISGGGPLAGNAGAGLSASMSFSPSFEPAAPRTNDALGAIPPSGDGSPWGAVEDTAPVSPASPWSSAQSEPQPGGAADIWGQLAASNTVDWGRSGFGVARPEPDAADPLGLSQPSGVGGMGAMPAPAAEADPFPSATPPSAEGLGTSPRSAPESVTAPPPTPRRSEADLGQLAAALGVAPDALRSPPDATVRTAGTLLRSLVAGLVVMLEARARAKAQLGAQSTSLEFDGNNPLKFARTPEQAIAQLLNEPERGFMPGQRAIEDAFIDLQSHQMATLKAMKGALRATLDRFSPTAISKRCEEGGLLSQIIPGRQDAALWRAYVKEFSGVAQGSDEAFMEIFAREFRHAYEDELRKQKH